MPKHHLSRLVVLLLAALAAAACDDMTGSARLVSAPSAFSSGGFGPPAPFSGVSVAPATLPIVRLPHVRCPESSPFSTNLVLIVNQGGAPDAFLVQADFRFFDRTGLVSPAVFAQTDLSSMFGTTLVRADSSRRFEFALRFGCGLSFAPHSLEGRFHLRDHGGRFYERRVNARVGS
jgi:hypothetical protein